MPGGPKVYVHDDVNPPQNPKEFLQTNDYVIWNFDDGTGVKPYQYDPKSGSWLPVSPQQMKMLMPPEPEPEAMAPEPEMTEPALAGTGAGTTNVAVDAPTVEGHRERRRAAKEEELRSAQDLGNLQKRSAEQGSMGGLSIAERAAVQQMVQQGATEEEAVEEVMKQRTAGTQADALEAQR